MKFSYRAASLLLAGVLSLSSVLAAQPIDMDKLKGLKPRSVGPAGMSGRITAIDVQLSDPKIMYVGAGSGGVWKSTSGGVTWEPIFDKEKVSGIGAVAIQQSNPSVIWVGTGEGNPRNSQTPGYGVYKSLDGGKTWKAMGLEKTRQIHRIIIDPKNPDVVYVGAQGYAWGEGEDRGVYKTTDGGKTWKKILYVDPKTGIAELVMDPSNPNKLFAAMWEYRRWPWYFKSGGPGSGLYVTVDGGETWTKRTSEDGLPEGELGKMGLAIARNKPNVVYALIESKKNALYRSDDGGYKWTMVNDKADIGDRPFYYAEIYVDPKNEQRLYTLYSRVGMSEDGGKSFKTILPYEGVHPDHHAWWIHPENPDFMIDGNDGGMAITHDGGVNWRFVENLPLGQYYHINYDMDMPYNLYGGMQDNGSWKGPAYVWYNSGIRNTSWQEISFGDGFDVVSDPKKGSRYGYAMSQGGNLVYYDAETGYNRFIKPFHKDGTELRFNWNSGIALDPIDSVTVYYGSQFLHKSTDRGFTWTTISPDLTSNDKEKQKFGESGGLTYDVTGAENHTTILAIAPSPLQKGLIWVGTDDGNVQLTQDGGGKWENHATKLKGLPAGSWIPQITASSYKAGEAFVVANNYRRDDWTPYLYRTTDFGKTWVRMIDEKSGVWGHIWSFIQDPVEPKLMFVGTEFGLYASFDEGKTWKKWNEQFPTVATADLKIHPREQDLIIGTFGRSAYVLDDIRPLRAVAKEGAKLFDAELKAFEAPTAVLADYKQPPGIRFDADAMFNGENRPMGARLTFFVKKGKKDRDKEDKAAKEAAEKVGKKLPEPDPKAPKWDRVVVEIFSGATKIRTLRVEPETGFNRISWMMDEAGVRMPGMDGPGGGRFGGGDFEPGGVRVMPGIYKVRFTYGTAKDSTMVTVIDDPRYTFSKEEMAGREAVREFTKKEVYKRINAATAAVTRLNEAKTTAENIGKAIPMDRRDSAAVNLRNEAKAMQDSVKAIINLFSQDNSDKQGIVRTSDDIANAIMTVMRVAASGRTQVPTTATEQLVVADKKLAEGLARVNGFFDVSWKKFQENWKAANLTPFKEYKPIEIK
jgi:photosystem II stability/assembly factor-like uncharacterized protein